VEGDIDLWVYGLNEEIKRKTLHYLLEYFYKYSKSIGKQIYFVIRYSVIDILIQDTKVNFQIIYHAGTNPMQIIHSFDIDCIECYYDGNKIMSTYDFIESTKNNKITKIKEGKNKSTLVDRLEKYVLRGFSVTDEINNKYLKDTTLTKHKCKNYYPSHIPFLIFLLKFVDRLLVRHPPATTIFFQFRSSSIPNASLLKFFLNVLMLETIVGLLLLI